jgi:hypothetical protein
METKGKGSRGKKSVTDEDRQKTIDSNLGIYKRSPRTPRLSPHKASKESYLKQEEFLGGLLCRDLGISTGTLLKVTMELGIITYPEEQGFLSENSSSFHHSGKSLCKINKKDILVFLGIRYDSKSATYNARVLLPDTKIVWIPFSCFKEFCHDNTIEEIRDFTAFFVCLLVKHDLMENSE